MYTSNVPPDVQPVDKVCEDALKVSLDGAICITLLRQCVTTLKSSNGNLGG